MRYIPSYANTTRQTPMPPARQHTFQQEKTNPAKSRQETPQHNSSENHPQPPKNAPQNNISQKTPSQNTAARQNTKKPELQPSEIHKKSEKAAAQKGISSLIQNLLPPSLYNPKTKKIFGILSSEDLLLVALIFLFLDCDGEDSSLLSLALLYILISEHFDLGDFLQL